MVRDSDPISRGLLGALGNLLGTLAGRIFLGAFMVLGGATVGQKFAPDRFTGTEGAQHAFRIEVLERYMIQHELSADEYKRTITRMEAQVETCRANVVKLERRLEYLEHGAVAPHRGN